MYICLENTSPENEAKPLPGYQNHGGDVDDPGSGEPPGVVEGAPPPPVDSWEDDDPLLTPDNEEDELADEFDEAAIIKPKKRPIKTEETKSKKEHVNVVFIGHVGTF